MTTYSLLFAQFNNKETECNNCKQTGFQQCFDSVSQPMSFMQSYALQSGEHQTTFSCEWLGLSHIEPCHQF